MYCALAAKISISEWIRLLKVLRYAVDLPVLVLSYMSIVLSWSVSLWLPWVTAVGMLLPFIPILTLLSLSIGLLLKWQQIHLLPFETNWRGMLLYISFVALMIVAGPVYAYSHGIRTAHNFIREFDLDVEVENRDFVLIESIELAGHSRTFRSITTVYKVLDPIAEAKVKLRNRLQNEPAWRLSNTSYFWGSCDRSRVGRYVTMFLTDYGALHVAIHYGVPEYCLLK
jgi:hypothetical protein